MWVILLFFESLFDETVGPKKGGQRILIFVWFVFFGFFKKTQKTNQKILKSHFWGCLGHFGFFFGSFLLYRVFISPGGAWEGGGHDRQAE